MEHMLFLAQVAYADQVRQVRDDPVIAGLNEPVVITGRQVRFQRLELAFEHGHQGPQRPASLRVALAVKGRQQVVQSFLVCPVHTAASRSSTCPEMT